MEKLRPGQTFPDAVRDHLKEKVKKQREKLEESLAPIKEEYKENLRLLNILEIGRIFKQIAANIGLHTGREARVVLSPEPEIYEHHKSPKYRRVSTNDGSCEITLNWQDSRDGEKEEEHTLGMRASHGHELTIVVGAGKERTNFENLVVVAGDISHADLSAPEKQKVRLDGSSKHVLNELLFYAFLEAEGMPGQHSGRAKYEEPVKLKLV